MTGADGDGSSSGVDLDAGPDPAAYAAADPEQLLYEDDRPPVHAVGIGPGNPDYLVPQAEAAIRTADVVVGFQTVVDYVADKIAGDALTCGYQDEMDTLDAFARRVADGDRGVAVLMGDPNHSGYQFLGKVERALADTGDTPPVRVVPGISSLQIAASRARTPMEETTFVTLHKSGELDSDLDRLRRDAGQRNLLVLPRPYGWMPGDIVAELLDHGLSAADEVLVFERLTHDDEAVTRATAGELAEHAGGTGSDDTPFSDLSVLAVRRD